MEQLVVKYNMNGHSERNLVISPAAPAGTAYHYESLIQVVQVICAAPTSGKALENLHRLLLERYGVYALTLEIASGATMRFVPYGDTAAIMAMAAQEIPEDAWQIYACPLKDPMAPPGQITYIYAAHSALTRDLLETATAQIALRLGQETLLRRAEDAELKARQRISEVAAIYEIGQAIDRIELPRLLHLITDRTARLMDAEACSLMLVNHEAGVLRVAASRGLPEAAMDGEQKIGEGIAGRVAATELPLLINGTSRDERLEGIPLNALIRSSMLVPLKNQDGSVLGVLSIRRGHTSPDFTEDDLRLFSVFASQAALAITNFRLYDDLERRAEELFKVSQFSRALVSTLELDALLTRVTEDVCALVGFDRCALYLRESPRSPNFVLKKAKGYPESIGRNPVREGEGAIGVAARSRKTVQYDTQEVAQENDRFYAQRKGYARALGTDAFVAIPILTRRDQCIGVVVADNRSRREAIPPEQVDLLTTFVRQAGISIENAQIHEELQVKNRSITRLNLYSDSVLQSSLAGIVSTDVRGIIQRFNRAAAQILALELSPFKEATLTDFITRLGLPKQERVHLLEMLRRVQETGEPHHQQKFVLSPHGRESLTLNLMISRLPDNEEEKGGIVFVFEDVTHEARLEARLKEMDRLADIGYLAARMAHEFRNALSPIKCAAQIIRQDIEEQNGSTEWPDIIIAEADGMSRLTSEMLDFARANTLDPRAVQVEAFLHSAIQRMATFLEEHHVTVRFAIAENLPELTVDTVQFGQVIRNIVMNAAQAMSPKGGELLLTADCDAASGMMFLRFKDTGIGIEADKVKEIFRPFVTSKTKGTGLGLPIVQKIVHQHGGQIVVESKIGEGTCFIVRLPLHPPQEERIIWPGENLPE